MDRHRFSAITLLKLMMLASLAVPLALFAYASWSEYRTTFAVADERIQRSLDVLAEQTLKVFQSIELAISNVDEVLRDLKDEDIRAGEERFHQRAQNIVARLSQVQSIWVFDAGGRPLVSSTHYPAPLNINNSERDYFRVQVPNDAGTYIGEVVIPRVGTDTIFTVSRRRPSADQTFRGVTAAAIARREFFEFYGRIGRAPGSYFALVRADGLFLVRYPGPADRPVRVTDTSGFRRQIAANPEGGVYTTVGQLDGIEWRIGTRKLGNFPVYISAGFATSAIRGEWLASVRNHLLFGLPATALLFTLSGIALMQTRRMHAEAERRAIAEQALRQSQKMEAVGQLTGGVAHDFNNLLAVVLGNLELLRKRLPADPQIARLLDNAVNGAERGASLTQRMLAFARRQDLNPEPVDVPDLVRGMANLLERTTPGIQIETRFPVRLARAHVDANQLELALVNLIVNARDAMPEGGTVTIAAREEVLERKNPMRLPPGAYLRLSVTDTGVGMDEATLARASEPFFTTKGTGRGTGLGLSMVHGLAEQSVGRLVLRSEPGEGTTAEVWLPVSDQTAYAEGARPDIAAPKADTAKRRLRILVVDDDPLVLSGTAALVDDLGHTALEVSSGAQALARLNRGESIDLVITDQVMPQMTGAELAAEIKRKWPRVAVILASGYAELPAEIDPELMKLAKPYSQDKLGAAIAECMRATSARATVLAFRQR